MYQKDQFQRVILSQSRLFLVAFGFLFSLASSALAEKSQDPQIPAESAVNAEEVGAKQDIKEVQATNFSSCSSPRAAAQSIFHWSRSAQLERGQGTSCVDGSGRSPQKVQALIQSLTQLIDSKSQAEVLRRLSKEPDYRDPKSGAAVVSLSSNFPLIVLRQDQNGAWRLSRGALDRVDYLQENRAYFSTQAINRLPDWLRLDFFGVEAWQLLALSLVLVFGLVIRKILQFILRRRLAPLVKKAGASAVASLVDVFAGPGSTLVVAAILSIFYPQLGLSFGATQLMSVIVRALFIFAIVFSAYRFVDVVADQMSHRASQTDSKLDDQLVPLVRKALKVLVVIAGFLFLLQNLDVDVGSLLAGLGIGGVAVALAAKDTVANFFGSLMIFVDRPFQIGDWVKVADVEGIVEEVGFRSTRVRTFYNSLVTIPNAHFTEASIDNLGQREYRRTYTVLNLTYDTTPEQMEAFVEGIRAIVQANPTTRKDYYEIHLCGFGAHSLDVMVYVFFKVKDWSEELQQRHHLFLEIMRLAKALNVEFAFPTQTLHLASQALPSAQAQPPASWSEERLAQTVNSFAPGGESSLPNTPLITQGYFAKP